MPGLLETLFSTYCSVLASSLFADVATNLFFSVSQSLLSEVSLSRFIFWSSRVYHSFCYLCIYIGTGVSFFSIMRLGLGSKRKYPENFLCNFLSQHYFPNLTLLIFLISYLFLWANFSKSPDFSTESSYWKSKKLRPFLSFKR